MKINVSIWETNIGFLSWDHEKDVSYFIFNNNLSRVYYNVIPLIPLKFKKQSRPIYGIKNPIYKGLPAFISDSVPDSLYGITESDDVYKREDCYKLYFNLLDKKAWGRIGAITYGNNDNTYNIIEFSSIDELICNSIELHKFGNTFISGRQPKILFSKHLETNRIVIGESMCYGEYDEFILKLGENTSSLLGLEMTYYDMAAFAGINVVDAWLHEYNNCQHLILKRFDIAYGSKFHTQTLGAICPNATSYESLFNVAKRIGLNNNDITELFRRLVFNILSYNTDDHNRNFSFLMNNKREWSLAPAYDMCFTFHYNSFIPKDKHSLTICGKNCNVRLKDIKYIANKYRIQNAEDIITDVVKAILKFKCFAKKHCLDINLINLVSNYLFRNLHFFV